MWIYPHSVWKRVDSSVLPGAGVASDLFPTVVAFSPPPPPPPPPPPLLHPAAPSQLLCHSCTPPAPPTQSNKPCIIFAQFSCLPRICLISPPLHCWVIVESDLQNLVEKEKSRERGRGSTHIIFGGISYIIGGKSYLVGTEKSQERKGESILPSPGVES